MFTCGSVCIDRNGLHKKLLDADIAAAPQTLRSFRDSYADKGLENRSSRQRMSRADLEAKRGAAEVVLSEPVQSLLTDSAAREEEQATVDGFR